MPHKSFVMLKQNTNRNSLWEKRKGWPGWFCNNDGNEGAGGIDDFEDDDEEKAFWGDLPNEKKLTRP